MPYSYNTFNDLIAEFLQFHFPQDARILDIGPGAGKYRELLPNHRMDCLEVHEPYVERFSLRQRYNTVCIGHVSDFDFEEQRYDLVILGDVLEHLSVHESLITLQNIHISGAKSFVAVPYCYKQGTLEDNIYEWHLQPDLTPEVMMRRYPSLWLLHKNDAYGLYIGPDDWRVATLNRRQDKKTHLVR